MTLCCGEESKKKEKKKDKKKDKKKKKDKPAELAMERHGLIGRMTQAVEGGGDGEESEYVALALSAGRLVTNLRETADPEMLCGEVDNTGVVLPKTHVEVLVDEAPNLVPVVGKKELKRQEKLAKKNAKVRAKAAKAAKGSTDDLPPIAVQEARAAVALVRVRLTLDPSDDAPPPNDAVWLVPDDVLAVDEKSDRAAAIGSPGARIPLVYGGYGVTAPAAAFALLHGSDAQSRLIEVSHRMRSKIAVLEEVRRRRVNTGDSRRGGDDDGELSSDSSSSSSSSNGADGTSSGAPPPSTSPAGEGESEVDVNTVLCEGGLEKKGEKRHSWKSRFFRLFPNRLEYFAKAKDKNPKGAISLTGEGDISLQLVHKADDPDHYRFALVTSARTWLFRTEDEDARVSWMEAINNALLLN